MVNSKIAIICPIGPIHKWGYQHTHPLCIASQAEFADAVYLVQSTSDRTGVDELLDTYPNITLISGPETWQHLPDSDDEHPCCQKFMSFHMRNFGIGRLAAFRDGYRLIINTHANWYVPRRNIGALRTYCATFRAGGSHVGKLWRAFQLANVLFKASDCGDYLMNLDGLNEAEVIQYVATLRLKWDRMPPSHIPANVDDICVVDSSFEMTVDELGGCQTRYDDYDMYGQTFDWPSILPFTISKFGKYTVSNEPLDYWGGKLASRCQLGFVSYQIVKAMGLE